MVIAAKSITLCLQKVTTTSHESYLKIPHTAMHLLKITLDDEADGGKPYSRGSPTHSPEKGQQTRPHSAAAIRGAGGILKGHTFIPFQNINDRYDEKINPTKQQFLDEVDAYLAAKSKSQPTFTSSIQKPSATDTEFDIPGADMDLRQLLAQSNQGRLRPKSASAAAATGSARVSSNRIDFLRMLKS